MTATRWDKAMPWGGVGTDYFLGNTMNASNGFDLVVRNVGSTGTANAVPKATGVTLEMHHHL